MPRVIAADIKLRHFLGRTRHACLIQQVPSSEGNVLRAKPGDIWTFVVFRGSLMHMRAYIPLKSGLESEGHYSQAHSSRCALICGAARETSPTSIKSSSTCQRYLKLDTLDASHMMESLRSFRRIMKTMQSCLCPKQCLLLGAVHRSQ